MTKIGVFKIESSFRLTKRGLVALGQIVEGVARIGAYTSFLVDNNWITLQISGVEIADIDRPKGIYAVGLTFVWESDEQRYKFETIKLEEQIIDIMDEQPSV